MVLHPSLSLKSRFAYHHNPHFHNLLGQLSSQAFTQAVILLYIRPYFMYDNALILLPRSRFLSPISLTLSSVA